MSYYLAPWRWLDDERAGPSWSIPEASGLIDLRLDPTVGGWALAKADALLPDGFLLADDLGSTRRKADIEKEMGLPLVSGNVLGIVEELLLLSGRQLILPTHSGRLEIHLGGKVYDRAFLGEADPVWLAILAKKRSDFTAVYAAAGDILARKWLGNEMNRVRLPWDRAELISGDSRITPLKPTTTIGDDFTDTDGVALSAHTPSGANAFAGSWTIVSGDDYTIVSNRVSATGTAIMLARAEVDLSSDDHYAETVIGGVSSNRINGPCVRFAGAANTYYAYMRDRDGVNDLLRKYITGTPTTLQSVATLNASSATVRVQCDGSTITGYVNGTEYASATDTDITGNTRTGIFKGSAATQDHTFDDFVAEDLLAASAWAGSLAMMGVGA